MGLFPGEEELFDIEPEPEASIYTTGEIGVSEEPLPPPLVDEAPQPPPRLTAQARKLLREQAKQTTIVVLALMDGIASILAGEEARMREFERELISDPLERMISRLDFGTSEVISKWSDPILLLLGISAWVARIMRERRELAPEEKKPDKKEAPQTPEAQPPGTQSGYGVPADVLLTEQTKPPSLLFKEILDDTG